jgi:[acyl-carrier-protein] S-malonyltransferase
MKTACWNWTNNNPSLLRSNIAFVLPAFDTTGQDLILLDELQDQLKIFNESLKLVRSLYKQGIIPDYLAGYSMGIYTALVVAKAITPPQGLQLIREAFSLVTKYSAQNEWGMCGIIGLIRKDMEDLIQQHHLHLEITNCNSSVNIVLSGKAIHIDRMLQIARDEGAIHSRRFPVTIPYHSKALGPCAAMFRRFASNMKIVRAEIPLISLIDQRLIQSREDILKELSNNLCTPLNWFDTQSALIAKEVHTFVECGYSGSLSKNARFIKGDFTFITAPSLLKKI